MKPVKTLNLPKLPLPSQTLVGTHKRESCFIEDDLRVLLNVTHVDGQPPTDMESFEMAGIRDFVRFAPEDTHAAIVTCGGLCPGLNDVIRSVVMTLTHWYGVTMITGIRYGYAGLAKVPPMPPMPLDVELVSDIHRQGGTMLGSSRGTPTVDEIVDTLERLGINMLFCIGGDGTLRGTHEIAQRALDRGLNISVIGIPKTIDNDIMHVYNSFGFQTAVEEAKRALDCAHVEAKGALNGVGLVKLMGRNAGFIAADATRASGDVNFCLIPEVDFPLNGEGGFLDLLRKRLQRRHHAVVAVAEGVGSDLMGASDLLDASGNPLHKDIGPFLKEQIIQQFTEWNVPVSVKYFDPSYLIRSIPADSEDSIFCAEFGRYAVTAAMTGRTDMMLGYWNGRFTHVPLEEIHGKKRSVNPNGQLWRSVVGSTGQPLEW